MKIAIAAAVLFLATTTGTPAVAEHPTYAIRLYSFGFQPQPILLRAGVPVTLLFTNTAGIGHEFSAPAFFRASRIISGTVGRDGSVELGKRESARVTLVPARGTYEVHCGHFMHKLMGMQTTIYVE